MKGIKPFLIDYILKKITTLKKKVNNNSYIMFGTGEEVVVFRNILFKESFTNDDINDLLICYSDHIMSDYELLEFVSNNNYIYYEMDEVGVNFDIRDVIIYYLLHSGDFNIISGVFKLFSNDLVGIVKDSEMLLYGDLNIGNTLYDLDSCYKKIVECNERNLRIKKIISLMSLLDIRDFKEDFKVFGITYDDIDSYIDEFEKHKNIESSIIKRLLDNMLLLEDRKIGDNKLAKEVLVTYRNYSNKYLYFNLGEFIRYYNSNHNNDFSSFYYNRNGQLDVEILYSILTKKDDEVDSFTMYAEFLGKVKGLTDISYEWQCKMADFCNGHMQRNNIRKMITVSYFNIIENLKKPIDITLNYYIYLSVSEEYREAFYEVIKWYYNNDKKCFGRNIFIDNDDVKRNTFLLILENCKKEIFENFKDRKIIHKGYFELIRDMIGYRYITVKGWNEYLDNIVNEYYAKEGLIHINEMFKLLENGDELLLYQEENFEYSEFKQMCLALCTLYPELESMISLVKNKLYDEISTKVIDKRLLVDKLIVEKHSEVIRAFIDSECKSKLHFLTLAKIDDLRFDRAISVVREYNHPLYEEYRKKILDCYNIGYHPLEKSKKK